MKLNSQREVPSGGRDLLRDVLQVFGEEGDGAIGCVAAGEAEGGVGAAGDVVVGADFEGELAAAEAAGLLFDGGEQQFADALSTKRWNDGQVVNVEERPGAKCGEAEKADRQTDGGIVFIGQENAASRMLAGRP